jgi:hypothetical protein
VRPADNELSKRLKTDLISFDEMMHPLLGIRDPAKFETFIEQLLDSIHRIKYVSILLTRKLSDRNGDPNEETFDPIKAAILHHRNGDIDEAFWLTFLFAHFGKHAQAGWRYVRDIYGRLGEAGRWDWVSASVNPSGFRDR